MLQLTADREQRLQYDEDNNSRKRGMNKGVSDNPRAKKKSRH